MEILPAGSIATSVKDSNGIEYIASQKYGDVYLYKSTDEGKSISPGVKVNDDSIHPIGQEKPFLWIRNSQILVSWILKRADPESIFSAVSYMSTDGGLQFVPGIQIEGGRKVVRGGRRLYFTRAAVVDFSSIALQESLAPPHQTMPIEPPPWPVMPEVRLIHTAGDLDDDSLKTPLDVAILANEIFFGKHFFYRTSSLVDGDVNCDGTFTASDIVLELNAVFLSTRFPC